MHPPGIEPGSLDSESSVLTIQPQRHYDNDVIYGCDKHIERITCCSWVGKGMARRFLLRFSITQKRQKITGSAKYNIKVDTYPEVFIRAHFSKSVSLFFYWDFNFSDGSKHRKKNLEFFFQFFLNFSNLIEYENVKTWKIFGHWS